MLLVVGIIMHSCDREDTHQALCSAAGPVGVRAGLTAQDDVTKLSDG